jgi:hypothetical protein
MNPDEKVIHAIDASPLNRGRSGVEWLAHPGNVPVVIGDDVALFDDMHDSVYQVHFLFTSRGRTAIGNAKEAFRQMFENYGAELIFGLTPTTMRHALLMARWVGGKYIGPRDTPAGVCELFVLSREMWSEK